MSILTADESINQFTTYVKLYHTLRASEWRVKRPVRDVAIAISLKAVSGSNPHWAGVKGLNVQRPQCNVRRLREIVATSLILYDFFMAIVLKNWTVGTDEHERCGK
ncbi:hypothetical protein EVAR_30334_1 [Eumeta japonica]|uniref:Uncharacterized protein n=1 Tax=Eumeta variegata TaxID=151549 RepID=A0A4C1W9S2_EUMVA|nr:hypothetical protein EVAR_30334_1 [Eumeta japonica]